MVFPALHRSPARGRRDGPLRPFLVQPRRCGAGHGLLHGTRIPRFHAVDSGVRADAGPLGDQVDQVLVLGQRRGAGAAVPASHRGPHEALEAQSDGPQVSLEMGRILAREGRDVPLHGHRAGTLVRRRLGRQEAGAPQRDQPPAGADPIHGPDPSAHQAAATPEGRRLRPTADRRSEVHPARY